MPIKYTSYLISILIFWGIIIPVERALTQEIKILDKTFWVPKDHPRAYYKFDCQIDPEAKSLKGSGTIHLKNHTNCQISRLAIDWAINERQKISIQSNGKTVAILDDSESQKTPPLLFELLESLSPGEQLDLELSFSMTDSLPLMADLSVLTDSTIDRISMRRFLPTLWWGISTQDDYDVKIAIPDDYVIATSGRLDQKTGYFHGESIRNFGLFIGNSYHFIEEDVAVTRIRCYYNNKTKEVAQIILNTAVDVITFFTDHFGFYPYKHLNIVPGSARYWGGFNTATSIASIHSMERFSDRKESHWRTITVHEIGHMYWGEYVMEKNNPGWLWLGLGIYTQREYARYKQPGANNPHEYLSRYADAIKQYYDTTIEVPPHYLEKMNLYYNSVVLHGKGYSIISTLDCILGHETFDRIVRRCLKEFGGGRLGASEFQNICQQESQQDLQWFFDPWLRSNTYPSYQISSQECQASKNQFISEVTVDCLGTLRMPVPVMAFFEDGSSQLKFTDRILDKNLLVFESTSRLKDVLLDPDTLIALVNPPPKGDFNALVELNQKVQELPWTRAGEKALFVYKEATKLGMNSAILWYRLGLMLYDGKYYSEAMKAFDYSLELNDGNPYIAFIAYTWKGHLNDILGKREEALKYYEKALKGYPGGPIFHSQYNMKIDKEWLEKRLKEPFSRNMH